MQLNRYLKLLKRLDAFNNLSTELSKSGKQVQVVSGLCSSAKAYFLAGLKEAISRPFLIVCATGEKAELLYEDIACFSKEALFLFPDKEVLPFEEEMLPHDELVGERMEILDRLNNKENLMVVTSLRSLLYKLPAPQEFIQAKAEISCGQKVERDELVRKFIHLGYTRTDLVEAKGEVSYRGGIIDIYPVSVERPLRFELFGDEVESIREFDPITQRSVNFLSEVLLLPRKENFLSSLAPLVCLLDYLAPSAIVGFDEPHFLENEAAKLEEEVFFLYQEVSSTREVSRIEQIFSPFQEVLAKAASKSVIHLEMASENGAALLVLDTLPGPGFGGQIKLFVDELKKWQEEDFMIILVANYQGQAERLAELLGDHGLEVEKEEDLSIITAGLSKGFQIPALRLIVITDSEIFGRPPKIRKRRFEQAESMPISSFVDLNTGDFVVHSNYGIGKYLGIVNLRAAGVARDFLLIEYAQEDKLYVPLDQFGLVQKYIGDKDHPPKIHRLGDNTWEKTKRRVKKSIEDMAKGLLELYALRKALPGHKFSKETLWQHEFETGFIYEETPDQLKAVDDVKADMEKESPMDRLVCGDVGYGKTEVALRAAFKAILDHKQVAVLVPTTILALQHFNTFQERLSSFPVRVEMLSRFKTKSSQKKIIEEVAQGKVDVVIGTHRLLQKDINFKELGLVVIDEEQRFGVTHKEKLKALRQLVDVLTLTATPIPRTLYMSLSGGRDMSVINTPPPGRLAIKTLVLPFGEKVIREAVLREMDRGGQIYFVHNRVQTISAVEEFLKRVVPQARIIAGHGQMHEHELEKVMADFLDYKYDILLSTSIIESGLDISRVNTIIIHDAHQFGLAQLYQLRGRVGRARHQAYAYLLYPASLALSDQAKERLKAISEFAALGSGFKVAMRDLEIRGAGNILGAEQHGNLVSVGFDLYCKMLSQAVAALKGEKVEDKDFPMVDIGCDAYLSEEYIPDLSQRFALYKKVSSCFNLEELGEIEEEIKDRYGPIPEPSKQLVRMVEIKIRAREIGVESVTTSNQKIFIELPQKPELIPRVIGIVNSYPESVKLHPRRHNLLILAWPDEKMGIELLRKVLGELSR